MTEKIKQLREEKNLTIDQLAAASGIHPSQIELIENGELSPSIGSLVKITRALGVRLGTIMDGVESDTPAVQTACAQKPTISTSNGNTKAREHMNFFSLAANKSDRNMEPFYINTQYCAPCEAQLSKHEGEEFIYILDGDAVLRYGNQTYNLSKGDSIYYDSIVPHCLSSQRDGESAQVLAVTYIPY